CDELAAAHRVAREAAVTHALHELRAVATATGLLDRACEVLVAHCGFERAMLSRTDGERWLPWKACFAGDDGFEQRFVAELQQSRIDLADAPLERGVVEGMRPAIVLDAAGDGRTHKPIVELGLTQSYVVAPIIPGGRVVGFFHGDHHPSGRTVDEDDRDALWAFAEGFGRLYERAVLVERLADQRRHIEQAFASARETFASLDLTDMQLVDVAGDPLDATAPLPAPASNQALRALMTSRELDVLELLVRGMGNREIAERLVLQIGTVKTHVKSILRKVGAANRAEAITLYVRGGAVPGTGKSPPVGDKEPPTEEG
ncbi:MAG: modulated transcriptional regulator, LuxR family, partial [Solirubrobacterales bacterium]|nr:modulated transcriptional regulator, LuxR family [Solirubrobacterales bacterium]